MASSMAKANMAGQTDHAMKVSLYREPDMDKVAGNLPKIMETFISELTKMTRKTDMVVMFGRMAACTKEALQMTSSTFIFM